MELDTILNKVPKYIKQWYKDTSKKYGQKTAPYSSMILIQHAIANGAKEPVEQEPAVELEIEKQEATQGIPVYNDYGEVIKYRKAN